MRTGIIVNVTVAAQSYRGDRSSPQKHVWRAGIVLDASALRVSAKLIRIASAMGTSTFRPTYTQPTITTTNNRLVNDADGTDVLTLQGLSTGAVCSRQRPKPFVCLEITPTRPSAMLSRSRPAFQGRIDNLKGRPRGSHEAIGPGRARISFATMPSSFIGQACAGIKAPEKAS
jgi:hypothetical protein